MTTQQAITTALQAYVDKGQLAGAATLVWRDGRGAQTSCVGWRDRETGAPLMRDTIFRIASMSKPVTSVAALMLVDEGRIALDEPIANWAPDFTDMRVLRSADGPLDETDPAARPITFEDLLTHRSGLTYGGVHAGPITPAYAAALGGDIDSHVAPDDWIAGLAALPLIDQPGASFHYSCSTDLLGLLVARIDGAPLGDVLRRRIFEPLGMKDTGFLVPRDQRHRRATMYGFDEAGRLEPRLTAAGQPFLPERPDDMRFESGGQGLWSTLDDYLAFARLFVGGGAVDGVRLLRPETVARMTSNHLTDDQRARAEMLGMPVFTAHGFGLGVAVVLDPDNAAAVRCKGGLGTVGWPGAYGGWWQADPTDSSVMVFLAHNLLELDRLAMGVGLDVYSAITEVHALGSIV
ncbi:MAG TPA: serine hydrolase domain-containing protein [Caulobacter sp.]|nr:serine hydrolase domain-containing protein [Caulobacter sp.]